MNIVILNGVLHVDQPDFDDYIHHIVSLLKSQNHQVRHIILRELDIKHCDGCFGCWVKKPGECLIMDDAIQVRNAIIRADFILWASPLLMGFPSAQLKKIIDKSTPLLHPYFTLVNGETRHLARYENYPLVGLLLAPESDTTFEDVDIVTNIFKRTALNMQSTLVFSLLTNTPADRVAEAIVKAERRKNDWVPTVGLTNGVAVDPPQQLTVINGSPRGMDYNTDILLQQFRQGFVSAGGGGRSCEMLYLNQESDRERAVRVFQASENVLLGFPLYTDAMPALVKEFIEQLAQYRGRDGNPALGFLVQSGFPEAVHSRPVERYLERLAQRFCSLYLGTIVKGAGESIRHMPQKMNSKLFGIMQSMGNSFATTGRFDKSLLVRLAKRDRYPFYLVPLYRLLMNTPIMTGIWDQQLKSNGVFNTRFARPYARR